MLLNGLPDTFENFCIAIESRVQIPGIDFIKGKLIEEEARRVSGDDHHGGNSNGTNALLSRGTRENPARKYKGGRPPARNYHGDKREGKSTPQRFDGKCFHCDRFGHRAIDCRKKKNDEKKNGGKANQAQEEENEATVALSALTSSDCSDEWYLDSGASAHMCGMRDCFDSVSEIPVRDIRTAGKETVKAIGTGTITLSVEINGKLKTLKLLDVLYAPGLRGNLLSVSVIANKGFRIEFNTNGASVLNEKGLIILEALKRDKMYIVKVIQPYEARIANTLKADIWHRRYGHLNYKDLKLLRDRDAVIGLDLPENFDPKHCKQCDNAKVHCLPFPQSSSRAKDVLELIHSDICGPLPGPDLGRRGPLSTGFEGGPFNLTKPNKLTYGKGKYRKHNK